MRSRAWSLLVSAVFACSAPASPESAAKPRDGVGSVSEDGPAASSPSLAPTPLLTTADQWVDLIAQRPSAVTYHGDRLLIDLGHPAALKHVALADQAAWALGETIEDRSAGVLRKTTGSIDLPLDGPLSPALHPDEPEHRGLALALTLRSLVAKQSVTVLWNEQVLAHVPVGQAWERHTFGLPAALVRPGENRLRVHLARQADDGQLGGAAVSLVEVGPQGAITGEPDGEQEIPATTRPRLNPDGRSSLELSPQGALAYYLRPPRRARLELVAAGEGALEAWVSSDEDHVQGRPPIQVLSEPLTPSAKRHVVDLTAWGGLPIRVQIGLRATRASAASAVLEHARVLARRPIPQDRRARGLRDLIVVAIEGARADGFEPGRRPALEELDSLLAKSLVFERAYSPAPAAVPAHGAWLSSVVPPIHLTVNGTFVAERQTLLPEALARAGYARVLATANEDVNRERGLVQGFDQVHVVSGEGLDDKAPAVVAAMAAGMPAGAEPWCAVLDVTDPQLPYEPPRSLIEDVIMPDKGPVPHLSHVWAGRVRLHRVVPDPAQITWMRRLYRGELQVLSQAVGRLQQWVQGAKRRVDPIIVVMGVHGEELAEHGNFGHGRTLYEESLRVPLAIYAPGLLAPGRVNAPVDLVDLTPTLADLLGVPAAQGWQGESLVPIIDDPQPPPRLVVGYLGDGSRVGIVYPDKLYQGPGLAESYRDLAHDPEEAHPAALSGGVGLRIVRTALAWSVAYEPRWRRVRWGTGANLEPAFAQDLGM